MRRKKSFISFIILGIMVFMTLFKVESNGSIEAWQQNNNSLPNQVRIGYMVLPSGELLAKANGAVEKNSPILKYIGKNLIQVRR